MIQKQKINDVTLTKEAISKLSKKQFIRQFYLGNISVADYLEFAEPSPVFSQVRVAMISMSITENSSSCHPDTI